MARKVFFSFHYRNDIWRVNSVRNHDITKDGIEESGYIDAAEFEKIKRQGEDSILRWIDGQLEGTSVTVVLIGSETADREYVKYEIKKSIERGNGLLGIYIHNIENQDGLKSSEGRNPFISQSMSASFRYKTYDWVNDNGYKNFASWVEAAAKEAGK
ncbi:MAG: TIR domain-containing protein [Elusimicrobiota bacterium]|jgi:hypothetical protein|nr:TIR domain-containing protein [Elusimicrobiota bacterium]